MKTIRLIVALMLVSFVASYAQQPADMPKGKGGKHAQGKGKKNNPHGWQPLMEMRDVMRSTFHPMLENNLKPARENAALMLEKAKALAASTDRPRMFRGEEKDAQIKAVLAKTEIYAQKVAQNASDEEVKIALSTLHGDFAGLVPEKMKKKMHKGEKGNHQHE